jgi:hypothetical protein
MDVSAAAVARGLLAVSGGGKRMRDGFRILLDEGLGN